MFDRQQLLKIVSGQRKDLLARLTRAGMGLLTPIYRLVIGLRNRGFDRDNGSRIRRSDIPVISVGNLTTGGTGKTPMVIYLARYLRRLGKRVVIVSRGYQGSQNSAAGRNDEALEMEIRLPDVPHLQDPDRFRMTQIAVEELDSEVVVLDDGFQHRQLHRELDIVLVDATEPFGYDRLLPRGLLREPIHSLRRADVVMITRCQLVDARTLDDVEAKVRSVNPKVPVIISKTKEHAWTQNDGSEKAIEQLTEPVFAFCAIGNPEGFLGTLKRLEVNVVGSRTYEDHHVFSRADLESLAVEAEAAGAKSLVCTHKDLVKIGVNQFRTFPIYALLIDLAVTQGEQSLQRLVQKAIGKTER